MHPRWPYHLPVSAGFSIGRAQWSFVLLPLCLKAASLWLTHRQEAGLSLPKSPRLWAASNPCSFPPGAPRGGGDPLFSGQEGMPPAPCEGNLFLLLTRPQEGAPPAG